MSKIERYPDDWQVTTLGESATYINGRAFSTDERGENGLPMIRIQQMRDPDAEVDRFNGEVKDKHLIDDGDLLFSWSATLMTRIWDRGPAVLNQHIFKVVPDSGVSKNYLHYLLDFVMEDLAKQSHGTTMKHVKKSDLKPFEVVLPPLSEQRRIADVLDTVDAAIQETDNVVEKQEQVKTGLLQDLLTRGLDADGRLRDPEREPEAFRHVEDIGVTPKSWEVVELGELVARSGGAIQTGPFGSQLHKEEYVDEGVPVVMPQNINGGKIQTQDIARITPEKARELGRHKLLPGDVLIARRGDLGRCAAIGEREAGWICGTGCLLVRPPSTEITGRLLSLLYRQPSSQKQVVAQAVGSTMLNVNQEVLKQLRIQVPPSNEQQRIEDLVEGHEERLNAERDYRGKLGSLKVGLMQDLLTGRVRVPEAEARVDEVVA